MDDRTWRIIIGAAVMGLLVVFAPQIREWLKKIGYRDWRKPTK